MKNTIFKTSWFKLLTKISGMLTALAIVMAAPTCSGQWYQPVVPQRLQNHQ